MVRSSFQVDRTQWLANFASEYVVSLETLTIGKPYPILHVKKQSTSSGWTMLLKLGQKANKDVYFLFFFYVLPTLHLSIFILVINQLNAQKFVLK